MALSRSGTVWRRRRLILGILVKGDLSREKDGSYTVEGAEEKETAISRIMMEGYFVQKEMSTTSNSCCTRWPKVRRHNGQRVAAPVLRILVSFRCRAQAISPLQALERQLGGWWLARGVEWGGREVQNCTR